MKRSILLMLVVGLLLSGCINVKQELEIRSDNTGYISLDLGVSEAMLELSGQREDLNAFGLKDEFQSTKPYLGKVETNQYNQDGYFHDVVKAEVKDFEELLSLLSSNSNSGMKMRLDTLENGNRRFVQELSLSNNQMPEDVYSAGMISAAFQGNYWSVSLKVDNLVDTNGVVDEETGLVTWNVPIVDLFKGEKVELYAEYRPSSTSWLWIGLILVIAVILLVGLGILVVRQKRKQPLPENGPEPFVQSHVESTVSNE